MINPEFHPHVLFCVFNTKGSGMQAKDRVPHPSISKMSFWPWLVSWAKVTRARGMLGGFLCPWRVWRGKGVAGPHQGKSSQRLGWLLHGTVIFKGHRELKGSWRMGSWRGVGSSSVRGLGSLTRKRTIIRLASGIPGASVVKSPLANGGDLQLGRSPGEGNGNPLQYSCLENPMDRGAWWATVPADPKRIRHNLVTKQ